MRKLLKDLETRQAIVNSMINLMMDKISRTLGITRIYKFSKREITNLIKASKNKNNEQNKS